MDEGTDPEGPAEGLADGVFDAVELQPGGDGDGGPARQASYKVGR